MNWKHKHNRATTKQEGFTLLEVMIAGALLAIVVSSLFAVCISAIQTQYMASNFYRATCLARNRLQRGVSLPFETLPMLEETRHAVDEHGTSSANGPYLRTTTVTSLSDHTYEVVVDVLYPAGPGRMSASPISIRSKVARGMYEEENP